MTMNRMTLGLAVLSLAPPSIGVGCGGADEETAFEDTATLSDALAVGSPHPGLSPSELDEFAEGLDVFQEHEEIADGLGPVFNEDGCVNCHDAGAVGGGSER